MTTLIIGGTGRVGGPTAQALSKQGEEVRVLTRSAEKAAALPDGITGVTGNLEDVGSLGPAFEGVDKRLLITANGETEARRGSNAVAAAVAAGVKKIVFLSVKLSPEAMKVPHYASKVDIEDAIRASGIPHTILRPDFFFQNDIMLGRAIAGAGLYTMPIGNKDDRWVFDDMDSVEVSLPDAPRPDEILISLALSVGGRPHARVQKPTS